MILHTLGWLLVYALGIVVIGIAPIWLEEHTKLNRKVIDLATALSAIVWTVAWLTKIGGN